MASIDISRQRTALLNDQLVLEQIPHDILAVIQDPASTNVLDAVSQAALIPQLTTPLFVHFERLFPDICARWILSSSQGGQTPEVFSAFARILRFAPYISSLLQPVSADKDVSHPTAGSIHFDLQSIRYDDSARLQGSLLAIWRLISFDARAYSSLTSPAQMQTLFSHSDIAVRYLAIRIFCLQLRAADAKLEALVNTYIGAASVVAGEFDGQTVDYGFLSLHEHARVSKVATLRRDRGEAVNSSEAETEMIAPEPFMQTLTSLVVCYGSTILPRPSGPTRHSITLVTTATTTNNLENLAALLQNHQPILLSGLPGSGKTSLVHEFARQFGKHSEMVTLHINEQTDAKMLVGLYSADAKPGSFQWRPGVLTTAVKEGRWVLIEDLDRAPNEVISTLLPLIERGQLLIPSRGETIEASSEFRLFATVRTSKGMNGRETLPNLLGLRFWQNLPVNTPPETELEEIIVGTHPILHKYCRDILSVYRRLVSLTASGASRQPGIRSLADRQPTSRDLLRWCRRLSKLLSEAGCTTGEEPISETLRDQMFMEAVDCFVARIPEAKAREFLTHQIAGEWHMSAERVSHFIEAHIPTLDDTPDYFRAGRSKLRKRKDRSGRIVKPTRPFANTTHAKRLLEQAAVAVRSGEPVLLVGETGIGKTTVIQQLADTLGHKLIAVNLSQQSEVGDLLGGFKPVNVRSLAVPLKEEFEDLFAATGISTTKNQAYLERLGKTFARGDWPKVSRQWREAPKMFTKIVEELTRRENEAKNTRDEGQPTKRRKTESKLQRLLDLRPRWDAFTRSLDQFDVQITGGSGTFAFSFVEGNIVKAARNGDWVLLDEVNLASPDTLESIVDLLTGPAETPSILLSETGEIERIQAHPNFRIFGAMNPATDVGKRDLPIGIRSRFTEVYVDSPDQDLKDLLTIVKTYLKSTTVKDEKAADDIARLYLDTKQRAAEKRLVDGANEVPHFSLRTLTRALSYVNLIAPLYGLRRALYEGFSMGFLTLLDRDSEQMLAPLIDHRLFGSVANPQALLSTPPKHPNDGKQYVRFVNKSKNRHYWLCQGALQPMERSDYIITPYVERNLLNLVRATSTRRFPILIQGPTSAGKTSMIEYLANFTGNKFVRINNHEHTDLQEYLGTYVSDTSGKLHFQEGLLVQAMRQGHWIVLDELNLAPTDVLEALNRLLDDNRELLIPETQDVVRPHENFMLFATQNPPGLYGGRKALSRAFRNRFLELHYDDIPEDELEFILQQRSRHVSPPDCKRIVTVYKDLSRLRQTSRMFEQKDSFATLRDLFRWTQRSADTREEIAINGFMLLAERVRVDEERNAVKEVIEKVFKVKIDPDQLYTSKLFRGKAKNGQGVVWTKAMRRLYTLVDCALSNNEPILLVGDTGCGKTTVCQLLAEAQGKELHIVNAHQNTETGDLIGSQRPVRNKGAISEALRVELVAILDRLLQPSTGTLDELLQRYHGLPADVVSTIDPSERESIEKLETKSKALFEWSDGSLVHAMKAGSLFLLDEISLADDSVLERLNSVLEPQRSLLLAEKGIDNSFVTAAEGFQFLATMNPGGDFGKKELSPALRNRFTEIWVASLLDGDDIFEIVQSKLEKKVKSFASAVVEFSSWFGQTFRSNASAAYSIRDVLLWVKFLNHFGKIDAKFAAVHGAATVFVDTLGANPSALLAMDPKTMETNRQKCLDKLGELFKCDAPSIYWAKPEVVFDESKLVIGDFDIPRESGLAADPSFAFNAPTTKLNAMRVLRALQMQKPILLEGSPGVGKTTLVAALARTCGRPLTRINLSDQTDLMDLFGTDMPVEGAEAGNFAWRDAPFLQAMQKGEWVLLDEMNLASQSVLEGLNACLDHRGEVYVSELDRVFQKHPDFRFFAAQNPHHQGGGRKGLPSSFVNRFVVVYADVFSEKDLFLIASHNFPNLPQDIIRQVISFVTTLDHQVVIERSFGMQGGPWEFNLRDILRWLHLLASDDPLLSVSSVDDFIGLIVRQRFRSGSDQKAVDNLFQRCFLRQPQKHSLYHDINSSTCQVGNALIPRNQISQPTRQPSIDTVSRLAEIESMLICVKQNIPCILSGPAGSGKSALLQHVASIVGKSLVTFPLNADVDTMDLVGGFEQSDPLREVNAALRTLKETLANSILLQVPETVPEEALALMHLLESYHGNLALLDDMAKAIEIVRVRIPDDTEIATLLSDALVALQKPLTSSDPRFEWLDGVIVKALQAGEWLVLDNANLCNASVLDRLNSLLEPNGVLSINEHCGPDGEPRIITPHPEFRIFLTADPTYGELSRAMRNRAVEIHLKELPQEVLITGQNRLEMESSLERYRLSRDISLSASEERFADISNLTLQNISWKDLTVVSRFDGATTQGLTGLGASLLSVYRENINGIVEFLQAEEGQPLQNAIVHANGLLSLHSRTNKNEQPFHPLQNGPAVRLIQKSAGDLPFWLGNCLDFFYEILKCQVLLKSQVSRARAGKLASLNRLQRSVVSDRIPAVAKDSTVQVNKFLTRTLEVLVKYVHLNLQNAEFWQEQSQVIKIILEFWQRTAELVTAPAFEEARFQAHLRHGIEGLEKYTPSLFGDSARDLATGFLQSLQQDFNSGFALTSGLSMEIMWNLLRPSAIFTEEALQQSIQIGQLAERFDSLRWKVKTSVADLSSAMKTLVSADQLVRSSTSTAGSLINELKTVIQSLEDGIGSSPREVRPYFMTEFETLRQIAHISVVDRSYTGSADQTALAVMAGHATVDQIRVNNVGNRAQELFTVAQFASSKTEGHMWKGKLATSLLSKLGSMTSASLDALRMLEAELPLIGESITASSKHSAKDSLQSLNEVLRLLIQEVANLHGNDFPDKLQTVYKNCRALGPLSVDSVEVFNAHTVRNMAIMTDEWPGSTVAYYFVGAMMGLAICDEHAAIADNETSTHASAVLTSLAWTSFAIGCIRLYVPDKAFDPQLRPHFEREVYYSKSNNLQDRFKSLVEFEKHLTGQLTSLRIQLVEADIELLGSPPASNQSLYRPARSQMSQIQGEFNNVIKAVLDNDLLQTVVAHLIGHAAGTKQELDVVQQNVSQIIHRLGTRFEAYQDIIHPTINILQSIGLGLALGESSESLKGPLPSQSFMEVIPLMGGQLALSGVTSVPNRTFSFLNYAGLFVAVEGLQALGPAGRQALFESTHGFFNDWSQKLEADRKAEEARTSLYRFRGDLENEEEQDEAEFNELFPTFDDENAKPAHQQHVVRDQSVKLAELHRAIFLEPEEASSSLSKTSRFIAEELAKQAAESSTVSQTLNRKLLPQTILRLNDELATLNTSSIGDNYNFYTDSNLPAVRGLVSLVNKVEARFLELQQVDEIGFMQPLADALSACETLLGIVHSEPLARILPKLEHLHAVVYEWQHGGYAPSIYGTPALYTSLTDMIISWRREELKTWAKLFDLEAQKCREDAESWFFMAYQVMIAVPLTLIDYEEQLQDYAINLIKELEAYFATSILGQFSARLTLVRQLQQHLELLALDYPSLATVSQATRNFITFYSRFEGKVAETITSGRAPIEKNVKNTVLLASWKDTNINALRESARKSHRSLFKLVRKFRSLLGQPAGPIIAQGLPDNEPSVNGVTQSAEIKADAQALKQCQKAASQWLSKNKRLANTSKTLSIMTTVTELETRTVDTKQEIVTYLESLASSIGELRKETPSFLTEENKETVKSLKTRKRNLLADVLKALRQMGFKHNLGTAELAKQNSIATVLGTSAAYAESANVAASEYFFHKAIDTATKVREATHNFHDEVTPAEINRGVGYMEGMVQVLLNQRSALTSANQSLESLRKAIPPARELSQCLGEREVRVDKAPTNLTQVLSWILPTLRVGIRLVDAHGQLSKLDNATISQHLQSSLGEIETVHGKRTAVAIISEDLKTTEQLTLDQQALQYLQDLTAAIDGMIKDRPDLEIILHQIRAWTVVTGQAPLHPEAAKDIKAFGEQVSRTCDSILVAVQQYKKNAANLPSSTDTMAWVLENTGAQASMLKALHMRGVTDCVKDCVSLFGHLKIDDKKVRQTAASMMGTLLPIMDQYLVICQRAVDQLSGSHEASGRMAHFLGQQFVQLASKGFCTPQEKSDEKSGESGNLEGGEGLGAGEGAEDISKDIQPDEDLSELAQEKNEEQNGEMEDEKDAVDMADQEMEGETGSAAGDEEDDKDDGQDGDDDDENEMEEEAGDVDDLDPTAVDEKMWDGEDEEDAEKDQKGEEAKGQQKDEQQAADSEQKQEKGEKQESQDDQNEQNDQADEEGEDDPVAEQEDVKFEEDIQQDQNVQQEDALNLPDEMDLDLKDEESGSSDDGMSDLEDNDDKQDDIDDQQGSDVEEEQDVEKGQDQEEQEGEEEQDVGGNEVNEDQEPEEKAEEEKDEGEDETQPPQQDEQNQQQQQQMDDTANADTDNAAPSDVKSGGQEQEAESMDVEEDPSDAAAQREEGDAGEGSAKQQAESGKKGALSRSTEEAPPTEDNDADESKDESRSDPFKKLGDALERWHRQQSDIKEAEKKEDGEPEQSRDAEEMGSKEFQHLQDDEAAPDAQALGAASEEQVQPIDDAMAIDEDQEDPNSRVMPEAEEQEPGEAEADDKMDTEEAEAAPAPENAADADEGRSGVKTRQGAYDREDESPVENGVDAYEQEDQEEGIDETSAQLSETHISSEEERPLRDFNESMQLWTGFQAKTNSLSLSLTSQLRLILTPSQSTKLSGSYRTGKRLNIKKIIPYIASSYKRDKIWMRRAVPTKRSYQILLCVDDSKSMGETSSGNLALESLVMVSRALTMLEVGQVGVLGFGSDVFTAHELSEPFASHDAGAKVLQRFRFEQDRTDVEMLVRNTIEHFREARMKNPARGGAEDLWQLALILSDGLTPSSAHDGIRRLLREAMEEKIMIVFIVMDDTKHKEGDSVLDLKEAKFVKDASGNSQVVIERYLDTFPFPYFLIVHNLEELPNALAGLLRTWFAEVNS